MISEKWSLGRHFSEIIDGVVRTLSTVAAERPAGSGAISDDPVVLPADLPRVLSSAHARSLGISRARVRTEVSHGQWRPLGRGFVLTRPEAPTRSDWAAVGLASAGGHSVLSGWDAVRHFGLGERTAPSAPVLVLSERGESRRWPGVHIRRVDGPLASRTLPVVHPDLPLGLLAEPARAVVDAAMGYRAAGPVRALVTSSVQKRVCTPEEICDQVPQVARRGSALLRRAVADLLDGARSAAEAQALTALRRADVPPFELNVPILDGQGRIVAVADFLWRELRAILEVDSRQFHFAESDWHRTSERHNRLTSGGLALTHYPPARFVRDDSWLGEVAHWLRRRARELGLGYQVDPRALRDGPPLYLPS